MNGEYDVFERNSDGSVTWRAHVRDTQGVLEKLETIGKKTTNECFAIDLRTRSVIGRVNQRRDAAQIIANETSADAG